MARHDEPERGPPHEPRAKQEPQQENKGIAEAYAASLFERATTGDLTNRRNSLGDPPPRVTKPPLALRVRDELVDADSPLAAAAILLSHLSVGTLKYTLFPHRHPRTAAQLPPACMLTDA